MVCDGLCSDVFWCECFIGCGVGGREIRLLGKGLCYGGQAGGFQGRVFLEFGEKEDFEWILGHVLVGWEKVFVLFWIF